MRTNFCLAAVVYAGQFLGQKEHPVEAAEAKMVRDGGGGHVTRACASYSHAVNAALALEPCSDRAVRALEAMQGAVEHCEHENYGSSTGGDFTTSYQAFAAEFQRKCVGLCAPGCGEHGSCTALQQCTCEDGWHGPRCEFPVCDGGCGAGTCLMSGHCQCPQDFAGDHCETSLTTTTTTTTLPVATAPMSYVDCAALAGTVVIAANEETLCSGRGAAAFSAFEADLPECKEYHIKGVDRTVGYLSIEQRYGDVYTGVHELKSKC